MLRTVSIRSAYSRQPLVADDGGSLALDWWDGADKPDYAPAGTPVVLFIRELSPLHAGHVEHACTRGCLFWQAVIDLLMFSHTLYA